MTFTAGQILTAAKLNEALQAGTTQTFTTASPAGSGWYRTLLGGLLVQLHWESTATVAATTAVNPDFTFPAGCRPAGRTALSVATGTVYRLANGAINADGTWGVYNGDGSARTLTADGLFASA